MAPSASVRGRWPRVNFIIVRERDYADWIATRTKVDAASLCFRVHMSVQLTKGEAAKLAKNLSTRKLAASKSIVRKAMDRLLPAREPLGKRGRALIDATFAAGAPAPGVRGRWPRVNFIVEQDFADEIAIGTSASAPHFHMHMDVEITVAESTLLAKLLAAKPPQLAKARTLVEKAMARVKATKGPIGNRGRAVIAAAFKP